MVDNNDKSATSLSHVRDKFFHEKSVLHPSRLREISKRIFRIVGLPVYGVLKKNETRLFIQCESVKTARRTFLALVMFHYETIVRKNNDTVVFFVNLRTGFVFTFPAF